MLTMDFKARLLSKTWWISVISAIILIAQQCGFNITQYIPNNYAEIINSLFGLLVLLGITVDTSTNGISDKVISNATVQAINSATDNNVAAKVESTTTSINSKITENSQDNSADASSSSSDKESESNSSADTLSNMQVSTNNQPLVDEEKVQLKAENEQLKATNAQLQSTVDTIQSAVSGAAQA